MAERAYLSHVMAYAHALATAYALVHVDLYLVLEDFGSWFFLIGEEGPAEADRFGKVEKSAEFKLRAGLAVALVTLEDRLHSLFARLYSFCGWVTTTIFSWVFSTHEVLSLPSTSTRQTLQCPVQLRRGS